MKKIIPAILAIVLLLCACGQKETVPTWQEQYDLGVRYLSEGNYEEAIIAFTAAIEIDPKNEDAYIGLADIYINQGNYEQAREILQNALKFIEYSQAISDKLTELEEILAFPLNFSIHNLIINNNNFLTYDQMEEVYTPIVTALQKRIELNPENTADVVTALQYLGQIYYNEGKLDESLQMYHRLEELTGYSYAHETVDKQGYREIFNEFGYRTYLENEDRIETWEFGDDGRVSKQFTKESDGSYDETTYSYENGRIILEEMLSYSPSGRLDIKHTWAYSYPSAGYCECDFTIDTFDGSVSTSKTITTFDKYGRTLTDKCYDEDGIIIEHTYVYDENGNHTVSTKNYFTGESFEESYQIGG